MRFSSQLFTRLLSRQLVLKQVMSIEDFEEIASYIAYEFAKDNEFKEMKDIQIWTARMTLAQLFGPYIGRWFSDFWFRRNILHQDEETMEEIDEQIAEEKMDPQFQGMPGAPPMEDDGGEGQEEEDGSPGIMVDQGAVPGQPSKEDMQSAPKEKGDPNKAKGKKKKSSDKKGGGFKKVADFLAKGS